VILAFHVVPNRLFDDGYITLRYAANLAEGQGFVYNKGESVWGTTTPLLTLLLSLSASLLGVCALEVSAIVFGVASAVVFWLMTAIILEDQRLPLLVALPVWLVILFSPAFLPNSVSGMETQLVLALMVLSLYASMRERPVLLGVLFALLLMARIDTLIWIAVTGGAYCLRHWSDRPALASLLAAFVLASLPWHIYAYRTFGSLIPQSVAGKAISHDAFKSVDWAYLFKYSEIYFPVEYLGPLAPAAVITCLFILTLGAFTLARRNPSLAPIGLFFFCFAGSFYLAHAPAFMWYFPPAQWVAYLLLGMGIYALWNCRLGMGSHRIARWVPCCLLTAGILFQGALGVRRLWVELSKDNRYVEVSNFIAANSNEQSKVFLEHIGLVGYRTRRTIIDNMGLVSPEIAHLKRRHPDKWLTLSLMEFRPDVVVLYPDQDPRTAPPSCWDPEEAKWFTREYHLATEFATVPPTSVYLRQAN
jgi:hypothetical protein